jgi:hypothetical protein
MTLVPHRSQNFTGAMNSAPQLLQAGSSGIFAPQISQNV